MTFKEQLAEDLDAVFFNTAEFAETVVYNGEPIPAIVDFGETPYESDAALRDAATIQVKAVDVAAPAYGDTVTIRETEWIVREAPDGHGGGMWTISVSRRTRPQLRRNGRNV